MQNIGCGRSWCRRFCRRVNADALPAFVPFRSRDWGPCMRLGEPLFRFQLRQLSRRLEFERTKELLRSLIRRSSANRVSRKFAALLPMIAGDAGKRSGLPYGSPDPLIRRTASLSRVRRCTPGKLRRPAVQLLRRSMQHRLAPHLEGRGCW